MEETKNKKGKTIAIVILIILLVALGAYTTYDKLVLDKNTKNDLEETKDNLEIANREKKEANEKIKDLQKEQLENASENTQNLNSINIYSTGNNHAEYAYNGEIYLVSFEELDNKDDQCDISNIISADDKTKSTDCYKIQKLNIKEKNINKIITTNNFYTSDAQEFIYIIFKDGTVKRYYYAGDTDIEGKQVLKDYKVKDLKVSCKGGWENCKSLTYKLTLLDGTEKTIQEK